MRVRGRDAGNAAGDLGTHGERITSSGDTVAAAPDGVLLAVDELDGTILAAVNRGLPGGLVADERRPVLMKTLEKPSADSEATGLPPASPP